MMCLIIRFVFIFTLSARAVKFRCPTISFKCIFSCCYKSNDVIKFADISTDQTELSTKSKPSTLSELVETINSIRNQSIPNINSSSTLSLAIKNPINSPDTNLSASHLIFRIRSSPGMTDASEHLPLFAIQSDSESDVDRSASSSSESDGSQTTLSGFAKEVTIPGKSKSGSILTRYHFDQEIGSGQFGCVYQGYRKDENDTKCAIKITQSKDTKKGDAFTEFGLSKKLARKRQNYANGELDNVVHIIGAVSRKRKEMVEYIIVMDYYPGSLRDLIKERLKQPPPQSELESEEIHAMNVTINILKQCVSGLKQLQTLYPNFTYNDWTPNNILLNDIDLPISNDILCKLSDFGKARIGHHAFGTAYYVSDVAEPMAVETRDINGIAVVGIEILSAFGSYRNELWYAIEYSVHHVMIPHTLPTQRDNTIKSILDEMPGENPFKKEIVNEFFIHLAQFVWDQYANFDDFEKLLNVDIDEGFAEG